MSAASARQSQRVLIDAPVRLTLVEAARTLPARALDLSEGGIRLSASAPLRVGDEVNCSLELDHERAVLSGRVRWAKPSTVQDGNVGVGVQFDALDDEQLGQLRRWLAQNSEHAEVVLLHVPSLRAPLRALGCVTADGLQLVATFPHLTPGAELEFQLGDTGSRQLARIERIEVKPRTEGGPLELALRLQPTAATRSRRNLVYGLGEFASVDYGPEAPRPVPVETKRTEPSDGLALRDAQTKARASTGLARRRQRTQTLHIPKSGTVRYARNGLWLAAAGVVAALIWSRAATPSEPEHPASESPLEDHASSHTSTATSAALPETPQLTAASTRPATQAPAPPKPAPVLTSPPASTPAPAIIAPVATAPAAAPKPAAEETRLPALNAAGGKSEIFVPMQGSLDGVRTTLWTDPLAVVIDMPEARISSPELLRGLHGGGVRRVRFDETRPVPRLQILLNTFAARFTAKAVPHGMLVTLEHDLRPMPR